jgi:CBS-domain-containing membrane protein
VIVMSATVRDVMTTRVVAVRRDASFREMAAMLRQERISAFPVIDDDGRVIGVVSEADMLIKEADKSGRPGLFSLWRRRQRDKAAAVTAAELMTSPPVTIRPDAGVAEAARLMYENRVKRLPVVNQTQHLIGIISRADVLSVFSRSDEEIKREVGQVILDQFPAHPAPFRVTVKDGVVTVAGRPETDEVGRGIVDAVRHIEGVVAVRDRLSYPRDEAVAHIPRPVL